jgi:hypothetical protein
MQGCVYFGAQFKPCADAKPAWIIVSRIDCRSLWLDHSSGKWCGRARSARRPREGKGCSATEQELMGKGGVLAEKMSSEQKG